MEVSLAATADSRLAEKLATGVSSLSSHQVATEVSSSSSLQVATEVPLTASLGSIGPLIQQIRLFKQTRRNLPEGVTEAEMHRFEQDLEVLRIFYVNQSEAESTSLMAQWWVKIVRELFYDTADYLDEVAAGATAGARSSSCLGTLFCGTQSKLNRYPQIAVEFSVLMDRVKDARGEHPIFQLDPKHQIFQRDLRTIKPCFGQAGASRHTPQLFIQPPIPPESAHMKKLVDLLALDDQEKRRRMVVAIFGVAGVGKTTAARAIYHKFRQKFQCRAFLRVSRSPDMMALLTSMLSQIKAQPGDDFLDVQNLIQLIRQHLQGKRYLIIIDDLWNTSVWDTVSRALPDGNCCSRIITTTQIGDVALACCRYDLTCRIEMSPLNDSESAELFFNRFFGSEGSCPADFKEVSGRIISKCGGLPLAIMNISSLLASEPNLTVEQLKYIHDSLPAIKRPYVSIDTEAGAIPFSEQLDSLPSTLSSDPTSELLKEVVNLIYHNLPPDLKTCLLYLSMYPEGYTVSKEELVNHWVAEGFIGECEDRNKVARGYFDDLVSRGMTQSVDTNHNGEVLSCILHHTVLDFIRKQSIEENFVIVVDNLQSTQGIHDKVRRLSVQFGSSKSERIPENIRLSKVRSLLFSGFFVSVPSIVDYRVLRVLELNIWADQNKAKFDVTRIHELIMLRYVKIECNITVKLPAKIRRLQYLGTLAVDARLSTFPSDIGHLPSLWNLLLPTENINVMNLRKLTSLQELFLTCNTEMPNHLARTLKRLGSILGKFINLKYLVLAAGPSRLSISCDGLSGVSPAPALLESIELLPRICIFPRLPQWFEKLTRLSVLKIAVKELAREHVLILEALPALSALSLYIQKACSDRIIFDKEGFAVLRHFRFRCSLPWVIFKVDAMPNLQKLKLDLDAPRMDTQAHGLSPTPITMEHLPGLQEISVQIGGAPSDAENAEYILNTVVTNHPDNTKINVHLVNYMFYDEEDTSTAIQRQEESYRQDNVSSMLPESSSSSRVPITNKPDLETVEAMVSAFTGAMNSLGSKFATLMGKTYAKHTSQRDMVVIGQDELDFMNDFLQRLAGIAELKTKLKDLRNEMKDMTYDVDDSLDHLMIDLDRVDLADHFADRHHYIDGRDNIVIPAARWGTLEEYIHQLKDIVRRARKEKLPTMVHTTEPWLRQNNDRAITVPVGTLGPREDIARQLNGSQQQLQVACIFGDCGVGKTLLVTEVYNQIKDGFNRRVFVTASKNTNFKRLLKNILRELLGEQSYDRDNEDLILMITSSLQDKRYLAVFDGVWSSQTWESIKLALPDNNLGSRVIMTTSISNVAESCAGHSCGFVYPMNTLNPPDSLSLFQNIVFGLLERMPTELEEVADKILDACGGIPLAITIIASLLAIKPAEKAQWELLVKHMACSQRPGCFPLSRKRKHMKPSGTDDLATERIRKVFHISYSRLPLDMKSCLLYLSFFPENHFIRKDRLIWRWIAEGIIPEKAEKNPWKTGESYFQQLIARKLIEQAYEEVDDQVSVGCQVHGVVYDLITSLSREENFVQLNAKPDDVIRRLSVKDDTDTSVQTSMHLSKVRSLTYFVDGIGMPDISSFQSIRVLDLEGTRNLAGHFRSTGFEGWGLLRYLGLRGTDIREFPWGIKKSLQLETLDLSGTEIEEKSSLILELPRLVRVLAKNMKLAQYSKVNSCRIQEISTINVRSEDGWKLLSKLFNKSKWLRILGIEITSDKIFLDGGRAEAIISSFLKEVAESESLQSLFIHGFPQALVDSALKSPAIKKIDEFGLRIDGLLRRFPADMANLKNNIIDLHISIDSAITAEGLSILGKCEKLALLKLHSTRSADSNKVIIIKKNAFPALKVFWFAGENVAITLKFESGSMPQLRTVQLDFNAPKTTTWRVGIYNFGIENLRCLRQLDVNLNCNYTELMDDVEETEAAIRDQVSQIPNSPTLKIKRKNLKKKKTAES